MKRFNAILVALMLLMTVAGVASAHVSVWPKVSTANGYERYTVRVPNEKDIPTVKVRVELPAGYTFSGVLPVAGWTYATEKDGSGKVIAVVWSGGEIKSGEFLEFGLSLKNSKDAGDVVFKSYQTYSDGSVVEWTGAPTADKPAPVVKLVATAPDTNPTPTPTPAPPVAPTTTTGSPMGAYLGGAGLLVGLIALGLTLSKK
jgi:uncharacterized protein YcnI